MVTTEPGPETLGGEIRRLRKVRGLTQWQLAESIDERMQQSDVSALERGRVALPRRPRLERIASVLGVSLGELLARSGWADAEQYVRDSGASHGGTERSAAEGRIMALVQDVDWSQWDPRVLEAQLEQMIRIQEGDDPS